ncbi:MAG: type II secretion system GspH family protein [Sulfurovum sp.]|nr:type II secretion system GspH family protein [Sulfurovum sp.]MCB4760515.1 type II secretion system GspH family protein [Sulfurovum sp.]
MQPHRYSAFTILELVIVIVILGILTKLSMSRMDRDFKQEAADNILSAIRYTQHLALLDNKHMSTNSKWEQRWWKIMFNTCSDGTLFYRIGSDNNMNSRGTFALKESAIDPANGKPMYMTNGGNCDASNISPNILVGRKYGVHLAENTCGRDTTAHIGFDHLGRPHQGYGASTQPNHRSYIGNSCGFIFTLSDGDSFTIQIQPETGYAQIVNQPNQ